VACESVMSPKLVPTLEGLIKAEQQQQANVLESAQQLQEAMRLEQSQSSEREPSAAAAPGQQS